mmetsp:Transcript_23697/g.51806  ORF Transcript_23697/g.51806 Transcript_23697/m.51806 type:complete len:299 (-) Transcript_23697:689-1585(-)
MAESHASSDSLTCPICYDTFQDPVFACGAPCQHVFCKTCIETALQASPKCPVCRATMPKQNLKPHQFIRNMLDDTSRCRFGCGWTGRRADRARHLESCPRAENQKELEEVQKELKVRREKKDAIEAKKAELRRQLEELNKEGELEDSQIASLMRKRDDLETIPGIRHSESRPMASNGDHHGPRGTTPGTTRTTTPVFTPALRTSFPVSQSNNIPARTPLPSRSQPVQRLVPDMTMWTRRPSQESLPMPRSVPTSYRVPEDRSNITWNTFRTANKGQGWSPEKFSQEWKNCKADMQRVR